MLNGKMSRKNSSVMGESGELTSRLTVDTEVGKLADNEEVGGESDGDGDRVGIELTEKACRPGGPKGHCPEPNSDEVRESRERRDGAGCRSLNELRCRSR